MWMRFRRATIAALAGLTALAAIAPASAEKPDGPPGLAKRGGREAPVARLPTVTVTISPRDQITIRQYYGQQFAGGRCPPGLAKKNNGCLPPGQARKWAQGQPLPAGMPYYALPRDLLIRLAPPPDGYQYVRVANDVLLLATGSRMVIDAVRDLGSL